MQGFVSFAGRSGAISRRWALFALLAATSFAATAEATHFRSAVITWTRQPGTRNVTFTVTSAWRDTFVGSLPVNFGDGTNRTFTGSTIASGPGYVVIQDTFTKTYATDGPFIVTYSSNARLSNLVNAADQAYRGTTKVDLRNLGGVINNGSPVTTSPPVIQMIKGGVNTIPLAIADPQNHAYTCRFSTPAESGIPTLATAGGHTVQITPAGVLSWNTVNTNIGQLYAVSVAVEETLHTSAIMTDFLIEIVDGSLNAPPQIAGSVPNGSQQTVSVGQNFSASFTVSDPDGDNLLISHLGIPPGASLNPASGSTVASGTNVNFFWTPQLQHRGQVFSLNLNARDPGNLDTNYAVTLRVPDNSAPDVTCPTPSSVEQNGPTTNVTLNASVQDDDADPLTVTWKEGAVVLKTETVAGVDALAGAAISLTHAFPPGPHTITLIVTDGLDTHTCQATIVVQDTTDPQFLVSVGDVSVPTDPGVDYATNVNLGTPTVIDNSGASPTLTNDAPLEFPLGLTIVTWTATDAAFNESTIMQSVEVVDEEDPLIVWFPSDVVTDVDFGEPFATVVLTPPTVTDNADPSPSVTNDAPVVFPPGINRVVWTVEDAAGNQISREQFVTVINHDPLADAGPDVTVPWSSAAGVLVTLDGTGSSDEDGHDLEFMWEATGIAFDDPNSPTPTALFPVGTTVVTLHLHDEAGGHSHDHVSITVVAKYVIETRALGPDIDDCTANALALCQMLAAANPGNPYFSYALQYAQLASGAHAQAAAVTYFDETDLPAQTLAYKTYRYYQYQYHNYAALYLYYGGFYAPGVDVTPARNACNCAATAGNMDYNQP